MPGTGVGGPTYHLRIEFADVLNLPQGAKVFADGIQVGRLTRVTLIGPVAAEADRPARPGYVMADVDISRTAHLPANTTAELEQATPLGDVHIALTSPADVSGPQLRPDDTIPLSKTSQSPPIEDILTRLATFVGSGSINDIQQVVRQANSVFPVQPDDTARISATLGADIDDLAAHTDSIHAVVGGLQATIDDGVLGNIAELDRLLTPQGVQHTTDSVNATSGVVFVLTALGPLAPGFAWVAPALQALDDTARAIVPMLFGDHPLDTDSPSNLKKLVDLLDDTIIPFARQGPKIDMTGVTVNPAPGPALTPEQQTGRIIDTLRMIGAVR
ncbi:MlaD family protein [Nocardia sp. BMG111209]|uniref:MlaD family protein n=1 Tax=Nocardia sp. BMG111209 TaxID=1160137 RepID=UPI001E3218C8|nr:MlaD family protein [Nocardia sp. BMG111209]